MIFLFFDPIYLGLMILGYALMFLLASTIAPKVAAKLSGKFTLYTSMILLSILIIGSFSLVIYLIFYFAFPETQISIFGLIAFVVLMNLITYLISPYMIKFIYRVKEDEEIQKYVDEIKEKLGYKGKIIGAIADVDFPNAFAFGNILSGKYVAVTSSLKEIMGEEELKAVIGHEIGHHMHRDNLIMLLFGILPSILFYIGYSLLLGSNDRERNIVLLALGIFSILVSFIIQILVLAFSRLREYYADYAGALATSKESMQSALVRLYLHYKEKPIESEEESYGQNIAKALFIYGLTNALANPLVDKDTIDKIKEEKYSPIEEFLATHPPIPKRLAFLDNLKI